MDRPTATEALRLLNARRPFVRATVVRAVGSVPGKLGAAMIVRDDGTTLGTVGGAALEENVKELARKALAARRGDLVHFDLQKWKTGGLPSLCGGSVDIAIEYVAARPHLLLWGGGHVAQAIAQLLPGLDYEFSVADDRPDWVGRDRFPAADRAEVVEPARVWEVFDPASFTHLYLLGYDAMKDGEVLYRSLGAFPNYIGLISSVSKREHLFAEMRRRGVPEDRLGRVHAPIGLPIGAETPAEIAVSVVAEIVAAQHPASSRPVRAAVASGLPGGERTARSG